MAEGMNCSQASGLLGKHTDNKSTYCVQALATCWGRTEIQPLSVGAGRQSLVGERRAPWWGITLPSHMEQGRWTLEQDGTRDRATWHFLAALAGASVAALSTCQAVPVP